jgi:hypothetical protein
MSISIREKIGEIMMKKTQIIMILCLLYTITAMALDSKWTEINLKTGAVFVSVYFLDDYTGWVIGRFPFQKTSIFKTEDGVNSGLNNRRNYLLPSHQYVLQMLKTDGLLVRTERLFIRQMEERAGLHRTAECDII